MSKGKKINFDDLIRQGEDIKAYKMLIKELYYGGKMGGTRKNLMERVVDEYEILQKNIVKLTLENGKLSNKNEGLKKTIGFLNSELKKLEENEKCNWCNIDEKCEANSAHYENPITGDDIGVMFALSEMQVWFNGDMVGCLEINHCPMCGRKLKESEDE